MEDEGGRGDGSLSLRSRRTRQVEIGALRPVVAHAPREVLTEVERALGGRESARGAALGQAGADAPARWLASARRPRTSCTAPGAAPWRCRGGRGVRTQRAAMQGCAAHAPGPLRVSVFPHCVVLAVPAAQRQTAAAADTHSARPGLAFPLCCLPHTANADSCGAPAPFRAVACGVYQIACAPDVELGAAHALLSLCQRGSAAGCTRHAPSVRPLPSRSRRACRRGALNLTPRGPALGRVVPRPAPHGRLFREVHVEAAASPRVQRCRGLQAMSSSSRSRQPMRPLCSQVLLTRHATD